MFSNAKEAKALGITIYLIFITIQLSKLPYSQHTVFSIGEPNLITENNYYLHLYIAKTQIPTKPNLNQTQTVTLD